jgi:hypothetical protein
LYLNARVYPYLTPDSIAISNTARNFGFIVIRMQEIDFLAHTLSHTQERQESV